MFGRAAYGNPGLLAGVDRLADPAAAADIDWSALLEAMCAYGARHIAAGGRLAHVSRHMVGLFHGQPGARRFRQILSTEAARAGAGPQVLRAAFAAIELEAAGMAAA